MPPYDSNCTNSGRRAGSGRRRRRHIPFPLIFFLLILLAAIAAVVGFCYCQSTQPPASPDASEPSAGTSTSASTSIDQPDPEVPAFAIQTTPDTASIWEDFPSQYVVLLDRNTGEVLAERSSDAVINPASMTKILTLLVAVENMPDWNRFCIMTREMANYCYVNKCSVVGYIVDEPIYAREALYGCILCSGADACLALAEMVCGSHEAFVEKMNEKARELGLSEEANFTNCVGLYDENLHCTVRDIALILRAALENPVCRTVLTTRVFTTQPTQQHPTGQVLSNLFTRRIANRDTGDVSVLAAKTGYVPESGFCAASYGQNASGREFLCVTGKSTSTWQSIYDHQKLYQTFCQSEPAVEVQG